MTSQVNETLKELAALDFDAIEAYDAAIERLTDRSTADKLRDFRQDHVQHTQNLSALLEQRGEKAPDGPDFKRFLTKGKVVLADLGDDNTILKAMSANEKVTNETYEKALKLDDLDAATAQTLKGNLQDEQRHKAWIDQQVNP